MALRKEDFQKKEDLYDPSPTHRKEYSGGPLVFWYSPILTSEEYEKRMDEIKEATAQFMRHVLTMREKNEELERKKIEEPKQNSRV